MQQSNCFATLGVLLLSLTLFAGEKKPVISQQPSWVSSPAINYTATHFDEDAADGYSDLHLEKQISISQEALYVKKVVHILSEAGVQNHSQVSVQYDPSYQSLAFHSISIIRGGEVLNRLQSGKIKTIQQEKELDRFLYNGTLTAFLVLDDVRKDDIIEYSYTLKGFNPIFKSKYASFFEIAAGYPVYSQYLKLVVPKERSITIKNSLTDIQPVIGSAGQQTTYEWTVKDATAIRPEKDIPSWYDPYPTIMVTEFGSWKEVADWAATLFPFTEPLSAGLQKKIAEIRESSSLQTEQVSAALRFVQDDVRYMGFEMGVNSHKPHSPSQVFQQRFGDCKDKAYLLCTMLRAMGINASPVLNNTFYKKSVATWLPTASGFDHVTVCVELNGKTYWFDPTISSQRGPLETIAYPDYQRGLVVGAGTTGLTTIPLQEPGKIDTRETFTVEDLTGAVRLKVVTDFYGSYADDTRYSYLTNGLADFKKKYREFYGSYFKKLELDSLLYSDNKKTGVFTTTEYYTIKNFWRKDEDKTNVLLQAFFINSFLKKPEGEDRTMPYALRYPARYHEEVEVILPEAWPVNAASYAVKHQAFSFNCAYTNISSNVVMLTYDYEVLSDHIEPEETAGYIAKMNRAEELTGFELYGASAGRLSSDTFISTSGQGFTLAYVLLGICVVGTYMYRKNLRA